MTAYLTWGLRPDGNLEDISSQGSGKTSLVCPFCKIPLVAAKGPIREHHFRHDGETCHESLNEQQKIPGWDHFTLSFSEEIVSALQSGFDPNAKSSKQFSNYRIERKLWSKLVNAGLIRQNEWSGFNEFSDTGLIIVGGLSLPKFNNWMRERLADRIKLLDHQIAFENKHPMWKALETARQQTILSSSLYLFEFKYNGIIFHKVGRTNRKPEHRLAECIQDVQRTVGGKVKGKVLRVLNNAGYNEQYLLYKYRNSKMAMGSHQEYLELDNKARRRIKSELTRLINTNSPLNKEERLIASGRWRYERKRIDASRLGIQRTLRAGTSFGRPCIDDDDYFDKYSDIIKCLNDGCSISEAADITQYSVSTVKRVKKRLRAQKSAPA